MATPIELFALVEMTGPANPRPDPMMNALAPTPPTPTIKRIIRTYESHERAHDDMELLMEVSPGPYGIIKTVHVER